MRIIAGQVKGRSLTVPKGLMVRPTSDYLREVLFNILGGRILGSRFLDLFAGSGAVGIEALSRGASWVTFVEKHPRCLKVLRGNLKQSGFETQTEVLPMDVLRFLKGQHSQRCYDIIFLDPPYQGPLGEEALTLLGKESLILPKGLVIIEAFHKRPLPPRCGRLRQVREVRHGQTKLLFYEEVGGEVEGR